MSAGNTGIDGRRRKALHTGWIGLERVGSDLCTDKGLCIRIMETTFLLSRETIVPSTQSQFPWNRQLLFGILSRNAQSATAFFRLPASRMVELGMQVEL
ncbi:MAG: hypothetical protein FJ379_05935 [Verrucomicrobia bacterium]|nr:hypothetical protein [Verrucomicrobiota bacterium]